MSWSISRTLVFHFRTFQVDKEKVATIIAQALKKQEDDVVDNRRPASTEGANLHQSNTNSSGDVYDQGTFLRARIELSFCFA